MKKPTHDLSNSKWLEQAQRPKSFSLSIMPKPSLNDAVDAWVASGGKVEVVTGKTKHAPVALNRKHLKIQKKDD